MLFMLLTITNLKVPASDLGYLLHKHPDRVLEFDLSFGRAHVFYPEAGEARCTVALLLEVDPVGLVRNRRGPAGENRALEQYVNDRPYVASSFLSVAIAQVFRDALGGKSKGRPELADEKLPLTAKITVLPCRGGEPFLRALFEPLGYALKVEHHQLDPKFREWGESQYFTVELQAQVRLCDLLTHLYVLMPVLDAEKHYWVGDDEVEKLLRHGEGWLANHPEKEAIVHRYLRRQRKLARAALERLTEDEGTDPDAAEEVHGNEELAIEEPLKLWQQRLGAVLSVLKDAAATRVLDLGCGEGKLLRVLIDEPVFQEVVGMDVSHRSLEIAAERLHLDDLPPRKRGKIRLLHGSLMYKDARLSGFDAACVIEVIEHLDPPRLAAFERVVFENARPQMVVITTPNAEYNQKFATLPAGKFRHKDHRFEWTREQFHQWAQAISSRFGYQAKFLPVGPQDPLLGSPTQMGVFSL
jgi:3' terminal RNA ribose 2'-O-methyltransferase Hen1